jgi:hypothetical protein
LADFVLEHLALVTTTAVFILVIAEVLAVARMNVATALTIVATSGAVEVALAIIVSSYWAVILLLYLTADAWRRIARRAERSTATPIKTQAFFGAIAVAVVAWQAVVMVIALAAGFGYMDRWWEQKRGIGPEPWTGSGTAAFGLFILLFIIAPTVWLPTEVISTDDLKDPVVGYVLATEDGWTSVLRDEDRSVLRFKSQTVTDRVICTPASQSHGRSLVELLLDPSIVVSCEEAIRDIGNAND